MGVNKEKLNAVERRLRAQRPDPVEPPGWVVTRVLAGIDDAAPGTRGGRPMWAMLVGGLGIVAVVGVVVVAIGVGGVFRSGAPPAPAPDAGVRVASADGYESPTQGPAIRLTIPSKISPVGVFERETSRLRRDAVQLADVVRKPVQRLGSGLRRF